MLKLSLPPAAYELNLSDEAGSPWTVTRVFISEGLNRSYRAVVEAETDVEADPDPLLGCDAALRIMRGAEEQRAVCGVVSRVDYLGVVDHHMIVRFEIVPAFELLRQRVDTRIWQEQPVQAIVNEVLAAGLGDYGRSHEFGSVARGKAPRDYCTQYRESDFDYVIRLLEEEGISYEFIHDGDALLETLSFRDANDQYAQLENLDGTPDVPIIGTQPDLADVESIQALEWSNQLTSTATLRRDYDWITPRNLLTETASGTDARGRTRRVYAHNRRRYVSDDLAERATDLKQASTLPGAVARGRSNCTAMRPGLRFKLTNAERPDLEREYLITAVTHSGGHDFQAGGEGAQTGYQNEFECVPMETVIRPEAATPKPRVHGPQTAIVTGPDGEEIHTDEHARVQVQFYWEEKPTYTAGSSCWVRVSQSWAGLGWGTQFIPRIGMEVVIEFLEGNPDRPLCTGCVYNGEYPPPFAVPDNKTQTGWRTNSSPGGGGFNELRFEDAKGEEHIYIHGQKDWIVEIENDHRETIGHDQFYEVGNDQKSVIKHDQTQEIGNDRVESIGNNVTESVGKLRTVTSGDNMSFTSDNETVIEAKNKITLKCGAASMTLKSNGDVVIKGNNLTLKGSGNIVLNGSKVGSN